MAIQLHNLKPAAGAKKTKKRLGRGWSSGKGKFSGRGMKGQRSRSGGKGGLKLKGLKANIQSIPKLSGFKSIKPKLAVINIKELDKNFKNGDIVSRTELLAKGLISKNKPGVKVLGMGKIAKKLTLKVDKISQSALEAVTKAGGQVVLLSQPKKDSDKKENKTKAKADKKLDAKKE